MERSPVVPGAQETLAGGSEIEQWFYDLKRAQESLGGGLGGFLVPVPRDW